ncbi:hypothetical protein N7467_000369 [Penicillium canescens]|nr:hypothetical protein N7467_000369 [Penicillium canescens]
MFPVRLNRDDRKKTTTTKKGLTRPSTKGRDSDTARSSLRRSSMPGLDSRSGTASFLESRSSLPYPNFSKAHSKEDVRKANIPTPDPTDLTERDDEKTNHRTENHHAPPSPPLTGLDQESSRKGSVVNDDEKETEKAKAKKTNIKIRTEVNRSSSSLRSKKDDTVRSKSGKTSRTETPSKSRTSTSKDEKESPPRSSSHKSKTKSSDEKKLPKRSSRSTMSASQSNLTVRDIDAESISDATSIAPNQQYSAPRKPSTPPTKPPSRTQNRSAMSHRHTPSDESIDYVKPMNPGAFGGPPAAPTSAANAGLDPSSRLPAEEWWTGTQSVESAACWSRPVRSVLAWSDSLPVGGWQNLRPLQPFTG